MAIPLPPLDVPETPTRATTSVLPPSKQTPSFAISATNRSYKHQYSNIYFLRLRQLKKFVEERAYQQWLGRAENPQLVPRVLEVEKKQICYIIGTVYMEMQRKPNVLIDIARDHSLPSIPPPFKFVSEDDQVMLEDESGRIRLVGDAVKKAGIVTGVIVAALGAETANGDFEVIELCYPGLGPSPSLEESEETDRMDVDDSQTDDSDEWMAAVCGLNIGSPSCPEALIQVMVEYLTGEAPLGEDQPDPSLITRLIIAGNSMVQVTSEASEETSDKKAKKQEHEQKAMSTHPAGIFAAHLNDIAQVMPIHLLPGDRDPAGVILPQQPFPRGMFDGLGGYDSFSCETNPAYINIGKEEEQKFRRTMLVNSGQPLNDMFKYVLSPAHTKIGMLESTLQWRHMAPTAPDTLWCHPYFTDDPFIIRETPEIYIVGGQKKFRTRLVSDEATGVKCRIVMVPEFSRTATLVLINLRTLAVRTVSFGLEDMTGDGREEILADRLAREKAERERPDQPVPMVHLDADEVMDS